MPVNAVNAGASLPQPAVHIEGLRCELAGRVAVVIVGRPNVGKSTFFNRLVGKRIAVVEDSPGITRDRLYAEVTWNRNRFQVVDTGGIVFQDSDPMEEQIKVQAEVALAEADVVIFLADVMQGVHPDDRDLANHLRGITKPVLVVVNKADNFEREDYANEFYPVDLVIRKGFRAAIDSYSAFFENDHNTPTGLEGYLRSRGVTDLTFVGLATDFCVAYSALDAARLGFAVTVRDGACRAIDLNGSLADARARMRAAGVRQEV